MTTVLAESPEIDGGPAAGPRLFAGSADAPRARRASDLLELLLAAAGLITVSFAAVPAPGFLRSVTDLIAALPDFVHGIGQLIADFVALIALAIAVVAVVRRRRSVARDMLVALVVATALWLLVGRVVEGSWPAVWDSLRSAAPPPLYPASRVAIPGALLLTAGPHLARPARRLVWWLVGLAVIGVATAAATSPLGAIAGALVAIIAASATHLVLGSSAGRPGLEQVRSALDELGVRTTWLGAADRQEAGYFLVKGVDAGGEPLVVKVYGRDAHDSALLATVWRTVWYRRPGSPMRFGRLQQVEHEALMTLLTAQAGVPTDRVVIAAVTAEDDALLVVRRDSVGLAELPADSVDAADLVNGAWDLLGRLQRAGIAHGRIDNAHLIVERRPGSEPGEQRAVGLVDFRGATVAASDTRLRTDEAQALVETAFLVGSDQAVAVAIDVLGPDRLARVLPFLQPPALTPAQRHRLHEQSEAANDGAPEPVASAVPPPTVDLESLRSAAAAAAGVDVPALVQLRRVSLGTIFRLVLPALAITALISQLADVDFSDLVDSLRGAKWWLVGFAVLVSQLPRLTQALSTLGASPVPLPLGPLYALQLAASYINVAIPATAARVAVNVRFFQKHGVAAGTAMAAGALDGFGGFVVQVLLVLMILGFTTASLELDLGGDAGDALHVLILVLVIAVVSIMVILIVHRLRHFVVRWTRRLGSEAWQAVRGLRSPRRLALLLGGNLASEVLFAMSLGMFTRALGYPIDLAELLLINISVELLAGLLPIPGGVGVAEGGLTYGLVVAGMPQSVAFAAVILYRLATFYLPPIWGYVAMRWLQRNDHL